MRTIVLTHDDYKQLLNLIEEFWNIYGDRDTVWSFEDLNGLREIGQEVIFLVSSSIKNQQKNG